MCSGEKIDAKSRNMCVDFDFHTCKIICNLWVNTTLYRFAKLSRDCQYPDPDPMILPLKTGYIMIKFGIRLQLGSCDQDQSPTIPSNPELCHYPIGS